MTVYHPFFCPFNEKALVSVFAFQVTNRSDSYNKVVQLQTGNTTGQTESCNKKYSTLFGNSVFFLSFNLILTKNHSISKTLF